jgi:hypothetical protein
MYVNEIGILTSSSPAMIKHIWFFRRNKFQYIKQRKLCVSFFRFMAVITHKGIEIGVWISRIIKESSRGMRTSLAAYKVLTRYAYSMAREIVEHIILLTPGLSWFWMCSRRSMARLKKQSGSEHIIQYSSTGWRHSNEINAGIRLWIRKFPRKQQVHQRLEIIVENKWL